jgi:hypothetical protein
MAVGLIVLPCLLAGPFARTLMAQKFTSKLESAMLSQVPPPLRARRSDHVQHAVQVAASAVDTAPQLTQLVETAPSGAKWLHEIKLDGARSPRGPDDVCDLRSSGPISLVLGFGLLRQLQSVFYLDTEVTNCAYKLRVPKRSCTARRFLVLR